MLKMRKVFSLILAIALVATIAPRLTKTAVDAAVLPTEKDLVIYSTSAEAPLSDIPSIDPDSPNTTALIWGDTWRQIYGDQSITYKINLPDNSTNVHFNAYQYPDEQYNKGKVDVSSDKVNWVTTNRAGNDFTPVNQTFLDNNPTKVIFIKVYSNENPICIYGSFLIKYDAYGSETSYSGLFNAGSTEDTGRVYDVNNAGYGGGQWNIWGGYVTYRLDLPDDVTSFQIRAFVWAEAKVSISKDNATWTTTFNGATNGLSILGKSSDGNFLSNNPGKVIYVQIAQVDSDIIAMSQFGFIAKAEKYAESFAAGSAVDTQSVWETSNASYGGGQWNIWGGYVTYRLDLPNDIVSFEISAFSWAEVKASISKDNTNWTQTFSGTSGGNLVIGKSTDGDFLTNNTDKIIYVKVAQVDADIIAMSSFGYTTRNLLTISNYQVAANSEITPFVDALMVLDTDKKYKDTAYIDTDTATTWIPPWAYTGDPWRLINDSASMIIYRVDLPDNAANVYVNSFNDGNLIVEFSTDKTTWVSSTASSGTGLGSYVYTPANQNFMTNNTTKVIYVKLTSLSSALVAGFYVEYNSYSVITNIATGTTEAVFASHLPVNALTEISAPDAPSGMIGTGTVINIFLWENMKSYTVVIYGDVTGDGGIGVADLASVKSHLLGINLLTGSKKIAGDLYKQGNITVSDLLAVKKSVLNIGTISQNQ